MRATPLLRRGNLRNFAPTRSIAPRFYQCGDSRVTSCTRRHASTTAVTDTVSSSKVSAPTNSLMHWPKIYMELGKIRLSGLVVATTASGYYMGCAEFDPATFACTIAGTTLAALSANTLNQWYEVANDAKMGRTMKRPLPSGRISPNHALGAGLTQAFLGPALLSTTVNPVCGAIAASNIALYAGCYTPLKVVHPINTWVGAVVGGLPPLIGYAAATGGVVDTQGLLLAGILYSWQFPHFMALAHYCKKDYLAGGYKMLKDKAAAAVALRHCIALAPMSLAAPYLGLTTYAFGAESLCINAIFTYYGYKFYQHPNIPNARQLFKTSLWQLPLLLSCMALHKQAQDDKRNDAGTTHAESDQAHGLPPVFSVFNYEGLVPKQCTARAINDIANGPGSGPIR